MGFQTEGAAREFITLGETNVMVLPSDMDFDVGAMIEPLAVAVHALRRGGTVSGANVLVTGAGPIGNLVAQVAGASGARTVAITETSSFRIRLAQRVGIHHAYDPQETSFKEISLKCFGSGGPDYIFECSGNPHALSESVSLLRKGGRMIIVAVFEEKVPLDLSIIQDRELTVCGTLMYQRLDYEEAVRLADSGAVRLKELITHRFSFTDYQSAYQTIENDKDRCMKVMIHL
jgi:L-iditol 2-dehydrogenase